MNACHKHPDEPRYGCEKCLAAARLRWIVGSWIMLAVAIALIVSALLACEPLPTPEPPEPEATCAESCERLEQWGCKPGDEVCTIFNDDGACVEWITCRGDCERTPQAHPRPACVMGLDVVEGDPCAAVDELCW